MVLNLTCNVEDADLITYFVSELNIIEPLLLILQDKRNDWPTHGASQALMQYAHLAMQNGQVYKKFLELEVPQKIR